MKTDQTDISVVRFTPGAFVEIDDPVSGGRRLALVIDSGAEFVDYIDANNPPTPLAILNVLSPVQWGDFRALSTDLLLAGEVERYEAFADFILELCKTPAAGDILTFNRAAKWAYDHHDYNIENASRAGLIATAKARARPGDSFVLH